jgi:C-terminal processing protease CtpA/Prc
MSDDVELEVADVIDDSPAQKAGVRAGDVILSVNDDAMTDQQQFTATVRSKAAGDTLKIRLRSGGKERVELGLLGRVRARSDVAAEPVGVRDARHGVWHDVVRQDAWRTAVPGENARRPCCGGGAD